MGGIKTVTSKFTSPMPYNFFNIYLRAWIILSKNNMECFEKKQKIKNTFFCLNYLLQKVRFKQAFFSLRIL